MKEHINTKLQSSTYSVAAPQYFDSCAKNHLTELGSTLFEYIKSYDGKYDELIILCIGTDRATGDSLGPLTGYKLRRLVKHKGHNVFLYGTLEKPVHAKNIEPTINNIYTNHKNPLVIAIDACLGKTTHIGFIQIGLGGVCPGAGVNKQLPSVGDIFITGVVNFSGSMEMLILQNTRLHVVMKMASSIAGGISIALDKLNGV